MKKVHRMGEDYYDCFLYAKTRADTNEWTKTTSKDDKTVPEKVKDRPL